MIPFTRPAPLSACTLVGLSEAKPQPAAINCSVAGGSLGAAGAGAGPGGPPRRGAGAGPPALCGSTPLPNMIITGTGPRASAGVTSDIWMSTVIVGIRAADHTSDELLADHRMRHRSCRASCWRPSRSPSARSPAHGRALRDRTLRQSQAAAASTTSPPWSPSARSSASALPGDSETDSPSPRRSSRRSAPTRCRSDPAAAARMPSCAIICWWSCAVVQVAPDASLAGAGCWLSTTDARDNTMAAHPPANRRIGRIRFLIAAPRSGSSPPRQRCPDPCSAQPAGTDTTGGSVRPGHS